MLGMQVVKRIGQPEFPASDGARWSPLLGITPKDKALVIMWERRMEHLPL